MSCELHIGDEVAMNYLRSCNDNIGMCRRALRLRWKTSNDNDGIIRYIMQNHINKFVTLYFLDKCTSNPNDVDRKFPIAKLACLPLSDLSYRQQ